MKNFEKLLDLIIYLDNKSKKRNYAISIIDTAGPEFILFNASHELKTNGEKLYGFPIQRITLIPLKKVKMIAAFHVFISSQPELINCIIADIGNHEIEASWGMEDDLSEAKILEWKYREYTVILQKKFRSVIDFELLPYQDVLTVSTDLYENTKESGYWKK